MEQRGRKMADGGWRCKHGSILHLVSSILVLILPSFAAAEWLDPAWPFRREITVNWEADTRGDDGEIATVEFYTAGHHLPNGSDLRIATDDGRLCNARVIKIGPGDTLRVVFQLVKAQRKYFAYWGNATPAPLPANVKTDFPIRFGLLYAMRGLPKDFNAGNGENFKAITDAWDHAAPDLGGAMIERPFIGYNPATDADRIIGKMSGFLFAPLDGEYLIAGAVRDRGAMFLDGKPFLYLPGLTTEIRYNKKVNLARGRHEFVLYSVCTSNPMLIVSLGWKPPGAPKLDVISRDNFGLCAHGNAGPLEEIKKTLTADFAVEYKGECFEHDPSAQHDPEHGNYSHRYRFVAAVPANSPQVVPEWDFGDGQTGTGATPEHVFLTEGVYPVRVRFPLGASTDSQTNKIMVQRDVTHVDHPPTDEPQVHAGLVARYDTATMPVNWLPWAVVLHSRSGQLGPMLSVAGRLAGEPRHADAGIAYETLVQITRGMNAGAKGSDLAAMWAKVPRNSDLQPRAIKTYSNILLWETADFAAAVEALKPFNNRPDSTIARRFAQALLLSGKPDEARKILESQPVEGPPERAAAISGALSRSVEFFIAQRELHAGEDAWEKWQNRYPADFLEGYSVVLRVKLMELAGHGTAGATVAEAFANAVPHSSYAPQLLEAARKLTADQSKRDALKQMLKQRYPEDPLSQ